MKFLLQEVVESCNLLVQILRQKMKKMPLEEVEIVPSGSSVKTPAQQRLPANLKSELPDLHAGDTLEAEPIMEPKLHDPKETVPAHPALKRSAEVLDDSHVSSHVADGNVDKATPVSNTQRGRYAKKMKHEVIDVPEAAMSDLSVVTGVGGTPVSIVAGSVSGTSMGPPAAPPTAGISPSISTNAALMQRPQRGYPPSVAKMSETMRQCYNILKDMLSPKLKVS